MSRISISNTMRIWSTIYPDVKCGLVKPGMDESLYLINNYGCNYLSRPKSLARITRSSRLEYTFTLHRQFHGGVLLGDAISQGINSYGTQNSIVSAIAGPFSSWWRHQIETFSAWLVICAGNSPVTGEFPTQWPVTWSFDVFFDPRLNDWLSKQSLSWWFETPPRTLLCHSNV